MPGFGLGVRIGTDCAYTISVMSSKRIKHVVGNPYHLWAHEAQDWAKTSGGNESFEGARAFSYAACIGRIVRDPKGKKVFLVSSSSWSVTTAKHQSNLRSSIPGDETVYTVPCMGSKYSDMTESDHRENVVYLLAEFVDNEAKAGRARKYKAYDLNRALAYLASARDYAKRFKIKGIKFPNAAKMAELETKAVQYAEITAEFERQDNERREREREAWLAAEPARREAEAERQRLAALDQAEREAEALAKLEAWLAGTYNNTSLFYRLPYPRLRVNGDKVETTMGADAPLEHVKKAMPLVLRAVRSGTAWKPNGETIRLGHYSASSISVDGLLTVGCHLFPREEIERFAAVIGE